MRMYRVTPRAKDDMKNIGRYTLQQWGKNQRNIYLKKLEALLMVVSELTHGFPREN